MKKRSISVNVLFPILAVLTSSFACLVIFAFNSTVSIAANSYKSAAKQLSEQNGRLFSLVFQENLTRLEALSNSEEVLALLEDPNNNTARERAWAQFLHTKDSVRNVSTKMSPYLTKIKQHPYD